MFGFFKTKPPLAPLEKAWTEDRMMWLAQQFGMERLLETPTLVPDYDGIPKVASLADADNLLDFLRTWMKIEASNVRLRIHSDVVSPDMIGMPDKAENPTEILVKQEDFEHRDTLIAAMTSGLAKEAIAERGLVEMAAQDGNWTAELLPAFLGLGAFAANATIKDSNSSTTDGSYTQWSVSRRGSLPSRVFGYAMALRTIVRGDTSYDWATELRQDAQVAFFDGMKYVEKTSDTAFTRECLQKPRHEVPQETICDELQGTPSRQILGMWELIHRASEKDYQKNEKISDLLMDALRHKDPDVRSVACATIPGYDRSQHVAGDLADALSDPNSDVRAVAATSMSQMVGVDDETLVHDLTNALKDDADQVVYNAVSSLTRFGGAAQPASKTILKKLRRALVDCNDAVAVLFMKALISIEPDAESTLNSFFDESDAEYSEHAMGMFEQLTEASAEA